MQVPTIRSIQNTFLRRLILCLFYPIGLFVILVCTMVETAFDETIDFTKICKGTWAGVQVTEIKPTNTIARCKDYCLDYPDCYCGEQFQGYGV